MKAERRLFETQSIRKAGTKNLAISLIVALSSYFALTLVAKRFGGSPGSDAYFFLLSITTTAIGFIGSLLATVFLPALVELRSKPVEAARFTSSVLTWCSLIGAVAALAATLWYLPFFSLVSRLDETQLGAMHFVLRYFSPILFLGILAEFFRVAALAMGSFSTAAISATFQPLLLIAAIYGLAGAMHEEALAVALLLSKVAALVLLGASVVLASGVSIRPTLRSNTHTRRFLRSSVPYWSANVVTNLATFYFDYMASGLGTGVLTSIAYAQRIVALPTLLILNPLLEIARTKFAEVQAAGDRATFLVYYNNLLRGALYFSLPVAAMYLCLSREIVSALFQRGALSRELAEISSNCLVILALAIPSSCVFLVNGRACESFRRLLWPSVFGTMGNLLMIVATFVLVKHAGYYGIPLARLGVDLLYFLPFGFIAFMKFGGEPAFPQIGRSLFAAVASSALPAALVVVFELSGRSGDGSSVPGLLAQVVAFFLAYGLVLTAIDPLVRQGARGLLARASQLRNRGRE